jgi:hypothetical protein
MPATARHLADAAADFRQWLAGRGAPADAADLADGRRRLESRRAAMARLIRSDPAAALEQALSHAERQRLPGGWVDLLEERLSTVAEVVVLPAESAGGAERVMLKMPDGSTMRGALWAGLAGLQSKAKLPVAGIALDGWVALAPSGIERLAGGEAAWPAPGGCCRNRADWRAGAPFQRGGRGG